MVVGGEREEEMGVHHIWWFGSEAGETLDVGWGVDKSENSVHLWWGEGRSNPSYNFFPNPRVVSLTTTPSTLFAILFFWV